MEHVASFDGNAEYLPDVSKITHPTISELAAEYAESGITDSIKDILKPLPVGLKQPLEYTFANHVTKERPLSILHIADELGVSREKSLGVAACIDVLWNVGIILDDLYDNDDSNANQQPSAWARFGKKKALAASVAAVAASTTYTAKHYGVVEAARLSHELRKGVSSLTQSRKLSLESPVEDYYRNYDMRSGFYTVAPIATVGKYSDAHPDDIASAQLSLARMNRSGQMVNDLQDFDLSSDRSRVLPYSDIRNGVASIPMRHLWNASEPESRTAFEIIYGKDSLSEDDIDFVANQVRSTGLAPATLTKITDQYNTAREEYIHATQPGQRTVEWLDKWLDYKQTQADKVAASLGSYASLVASQ